MFYDQICKSTVLKEHIYHYDGADEGSKERTLKFLGDAVEKHLDRKVRHANRQ